MNVAVIGASDNPEKYSNKAVKLLLEEGHRVFPVNPSGRPVEGIASYHSVAEIAEPIDTVSLYVGKDISSKITGELLDKKPRRILFNPGSENPELQAEATRRGILAQSVCTLVLLTTNQFGK